MATRSRKPVQRSSPTAFHIALLRGVNVGGKNKLPMADLVQCVSAAGGADVQTYIQSGNFVFAAKRSDAARIARLTSERIAKRFGFQPVIVVRSAEEVRAAIDANPFLKKGADPDAVFLGFLADLPEASRVSGLDPRRSPGDSFQVLGREIHLHLPNGVAKSKLTNAHFDSKLATTSTFRNLRTVLKLLEMAQR